MELPMEHPAVRAAAGVGPAVLASLQAEYKSSTQAARRLVRAFGKVLRYKTSCLSAKVRTDSMMPCDMPKPPSGAGDLPEGTDEEAVRYIHHNPMYTQAAAKPAATKRQIKQMIRMRLQRLYLQQQQQQQAASGKAVPQQQQAASGKAAPQQQQQQVANSQANPQQSKSKAEHKRSKPQQQTQQQQQQQQRHGKGSVPDVAWEESEAPELVLAPTQQCEMMLPPPPVKPGRESHRTAQIFVLQEGVYTGEHDARRISGFGAPLAVGVAPAPAAAGPLPAARVPHMAPPLPFISICTGPAEGSSPVATAPAKRPPALRSPSAAAGSNAEAEAEQAPRLKPSRKPALPVEARGKVGKPLVPQSPPELDEELAIALLPRKPALPAEARGKAHLSKAEQQAEQGEASGAYPCRSKGLYDAQVGGSVQLSRRPTLPSEARGRVAAVMRDADPQLRHSAEGKLPRRGMAVAVAAGGMSVTHSCHWPCSSPTSKTPAAPTVSTPKASESSPSSKKAPAKPASTAAPSPLTMSGGSAVSVGPHDLAILVVPAVALLNHKPLPYDRPDWGCRSLPEWREAAKVDESYGRWLAYLSAWQPTVLVRADGSVVV